MMDVKTKKYVIVDDATTAHRVIFNEAMYDTKEDALKDAERQWNHLSDYDRNNRDAFFVGLYELDEDGCPADMIELIKEYK